MRFSGFSVVHALSSRGDSSQEDSAERGWEIGALRRSVNSVNHAREWLREHKAGVGKGERVGIRDM